MQQKIQATTWCRQARKAQQKKYHCPLFEPIKGSRGDVAFPLEHFLQHVNHCPNTNMLIIAQISTPKKKKSKKKRGE
jgi:4-aminobutyrate aminotransferase-like enzyme